MPDVDRDAIELRSFRVCFDLERRIYRIDRWRIPVSWGIPLRGIAYAAICLLAVLVASRLPILSVAVSSLPAPVRFVLVPVGVAAALTQIRVDGRPAHGAVGAFLRHRFGPSHVAGYAPFGEASTVARYGDVAIAPDCVGALRRGRIVGPTRLWVGTPAQTRVRRERVTVRPATGSGDRPGEQIDLAAGQRFEVER